MHRYDADEQMMTADDAKCVNCHRCVSLCPTRALKIVRTDHTFKENANWTKDNIQNVYRQAATGGVTDDSGITASFNQLQQQLQNLLARSNPTE